MLSIYISAIYIYIYIRDGNKAANFRGNSAMIGLDETRRKRMFPLEREYIDEYSIFIGSQDCRATAENTTLIFLHKIFIVPENMRLRVQPARNFSFFFCGPRDLYTYPGQFSKELKTRTRLSFIRGPHTCNLTRHVTICAVHQDNTVPVARKGRPF